MPGGNKLLNIENRVSGYERQHCLTYSCFFVYYKTNSY